ncbi:hypothetical protein [Microbacter margulisiae]|uniref:Uncharacterized protein n=1 Tax=Microbacter margulisiae TaxID=1350067 RepID=A0A7W5H0N2_9PORP|nr:hypothetical protein [Microbacter margulisiae]MBB3185870.1 hypothetical protein [Microbacter margulisiae]
MYKNTKQRLLPQMQFMERFTVWLYQDFGGDSLLNCGMTRNCFVTVVWMMEMPLYGKSYMNR